MNPQALIDRCESEHSYLEREHLGDPSLQTGIYAKPAAADITNSIATADAAARLAGLPTYTELAQALRNLIKLAVPQAQEDIQKVQRAATLTCRIPS